jgi:guanylate kinase
MGELMGAYPKLIKPLESVTTRPRRPTDTRQGEYRFVNEQEFDALDHAGQFAWTTQAHGLPYRYGTRKTVVRSALVNSGVYVANLTLNAVPILHQLAGEVAGRAYSTEAIVLSLYLFIEDETELRRRYAADKRDPAEQEARMDYQAINTAAGNVNGLLRMIDASKSPKVVFGQALIQIKAAFPDLQLV